WMNFIVALILIHIFDKQNSIINILLIPCFAGLYIYEFKAQEAIDFEEEGGVMKVVNQKRQLLIIGRNALIFTIAMSLYNYFIADYQEAPWRAIRHAALAGIAMGLFQYFRLKRMLKMANEEKENVS
ncbi:MAG: hypothetical protein V4642_04025, partial [Bacteroidota bacterium]